MNITTVDREMLKSIDPAVLFQETLRFKPDLLQKTVLRQHGDRTILNCTRQWGKSTVVSVLAYHKAKYRPGSLVLLLSPSLRQSSELFRKVLTVEEGDETALRKIEDSKLYMTLENGSRIVSLPGREGTVRGYSGANLIIIDEASRVLNELYIALKPMLAVSEGSLILMSTPCGKRGFFFKEWFEGRRWKRFEINAYQCPRISKRFLEQERKSMPERWFMQEYMCQFMETEEQLIPYDLIQSAMTDKTEPFFKDMLDSSVRPFFEDSA